MFLSSSRSMTSNNALIPELAVDGIERGGDLDLNAGSIRGLTAASPSVT